MYCKYCGNHIDDNSVFCCKCGKIINKSESKALTSQMTEKEITKQESTVAQIHNKSNSTYTGKYASNSFSQKNTPSSSIIRTLLHGIWILIVIIGGCYSLNPDNNLLNIHDMREAYSYSKEIVAEQIQTPNYDFPRFEAEFVNQRPEIIVYEDIEYRVFTVSAYVDAENMFGAYMRCRYVVEVGFPTDNNIDSIYYNIISLG